MSVITIFYNAEAHFREAVDSVLAQDFTDFELLFVDDGSEDSSTAMARDYAANDHRIRYLEHPDHANRGMSAARNLGLGEARGEFVAFIDADDRWRPSKLREQVDLLDRLPEVDAVGGAVNYWSSHSGARDRIIPTAHVRNRPILPGEATLALYPLGKAHAPSMSDLMFRRAGIAKVGGFEEAFRGAYEDQAFLAKFYLGATLYVTNRVWSDYRLHTGSCMAQVARTGTYNDARRKFLIWFENYLATTPFRDDPDIRKALARNLKQYREAGGLRGAAKSLPFAVPIVRAAREAVNRLRPILAPGPAILMYHRIAEESFDPWGLTVSPVNFAEHLDWITRNRKALPLAEFAELHRVDKLPRNAVAVTFDDGYACAGQVAKPLLEKFGVPATIFLSPNLIRDGREFWWDELERIVLNSTNDFLQLDGQEIYLGSPTPEDRIWAPTAGPRTSRQRAYREIYELLYGMTGSDLEAAMAQLRQQSGVRDEVRDSHRPLTTDEVRSTRGDLVEFGSHALTHPSLPLLDATEKAREIDGSVAACAELTGVEPRSFAYPYGDHDPESQRLVEKAGFLCACRADGWFVRGSTDRFALPRIFVGNWDSARLARVLGRP